MTVIPFDARRIARPTAIDSPRGAAIATGAFAAPSGSRGTFTGTYRVERLLDQFGQTAAAGVFTGELADADGRRVGVGSRRHTAAVEPVPGTGGGEVTMGPLDVNLLGFLVRMDEVTFAVSDELLQHRPAPRLPASVSELLSLVASTTGDRRTSGYENRDGGR